MTEKIKEITCCGENPSIYRKIDVDGKEGVGIVCEICQIKTANVNEKKAIEDFRKIAKPDYSKDEFQSMEHKGVNTGSGNPKKDNRYPKSSAPKKETNRNMNNNTSLAIRNAGEIATSFHSRLNELSAIISPIVSGNQSAMDRLMNNNTVRYPLTLTGNNWDKIWSNEAGQHSIVKGIEDALILGAELGKMGDLVPYGDTCQFIPSVEAFEFALTNGNNAPFENITIECIYESDDYVSGRKKGDFFLDFNSFGKTREKVIMVAVYGLLKKTGYVVGEMYDADRLLEKARAHSKPFANYSKIMKAFEYAKSEGKTSVDDNGREWFIYYVVKDSSNDKYFQQSVDYFKAQEAAGKLKTDGKGEYSSQMLPKKNSNEKWEKKTYRYEVEGGKEQKTIYIDELENPYAGADQPEMLRKAAGKSFLSKFAKIRNSEAAMDEVRSSESMRKNAVDLAKDQFEDDIIDMV